MLRRTAVLFLSLGLVACTEIPPDPGAGGSGTGGDGGAGGVDACTTVLPEKTSEIEGDDNVVSAGANGNVSADTDPVDRWAITTCGGTHDVVLTWGEMGQGFDLDLVLFDSEDEFVAKGVPVGMPHDEESLEGFDLPDGEQFFVEVQAVNTSEIDFLNYNLTVTRN